MSELELLQELVEQQKYTNRLLELLAGPERMRSLRLEDEVKKAMQHRHAAAKKWRETQEAI